MATVVVRNALTPFPTTVDYRVVPWVTFTDPEVARVGMTVEEAAAAGERPQVFRSDFAELDRGIGEGGSATAGFGKVVTRPNGKILGATIVGRGAGELIMEFVLAMRLGIPLPRLARFIHPYPTMSEIVSRTAAAWYRRKYTGTRAARLVQRLVRWWLLARGRAGPSNSSRWCCCSPVAAWACAPRGLAGCSRRTARVAS